MKAGLLLFRIICVSCAALLSISLSFSGSTAVAQSSSRTMPIVFDIPAQPLVQALIAYGGATGLDIFYDADLGEQQHSTEVRGAFTASEALQLLLLGTGYNARSTGPGVFTIAPATRTSLANPAAPTAAQAYRPYFATIQARVSDALCRNAPNAAARDEALFRFWLAPSGLIARAEVVTDDGALAEDQALAVALQGIVIGAPPADMPQPVNMAIYPPTGSSTSCHSTPTRAGIGSRAESRPQ
ncbi:STN domain-containing protein [Bradyrhizobium sp. Ai1a-2]|uniref:STN domain-containing protein n=1 Tax=Bradyrhizobium sp. Ai1a-2 TaxID=196490 RepID=UPI00126947B4|nr:STN domain-containing protein [Bradyrhizobium sp. Ai1a-2]